MNFGQHITVERQLSPRDYYCRCRISGELFPAHIRNEYRDAFADTGDRESHPSWCPFLRSTGGGSYACTIHDTAPRFCREFRCVTMVIFDREGNETGRVKGRRSLESRDPVLTAVWNERVAGVHPGDDHQFLRYAVRVLKEAGYRAEPVE
jgi:Fe-S-cluster containining protein